MSCLYRSHLLVNTGDNPDRPDWRITRRWLRNLYRVHQRLCMAFPSAEAKAEDPHFVKSYGTQVHQSRNGERGFLFRIDPLPGGRTIIVVQSAIEPDWDYAFHNAGHFLAAPPQGSAPFDLQPHEGNRFCFRLVANPVYRAHKNTVDQRGKKIEEKWVKKRLPVVATDEALSNWLERRASTSGFAVEELSLIQPGYVYFNKSGKRGEGHRLRSVRFEGILDVTAAGDFRKALESGIGPAKAFGFGLLSIAPA